MCSPFKQAADSRGRYVLSEPASSEEIIYMAKCLLSRRFRRGTVLSSPSMSRDYLQSRLAAYEHEVFAALFLDNRHRVISFEEMFKGTIDGATVHPREVVKAALEHNAAAVIFAHNHPSGVAEPSRADQNITQRLKEALTMVDIRVLDHFIIGSDEVVSFAERGLL
ncbi:MAG: DNA repair protein RadC [Gammaproteobacteria bacterium]|jgi:DNA repair protein RadC|nr:DNA repair protein RadC [Gammaproteobacteria bacterium]